MWQLTTVLSEGHAEAHYFTLLEIQLAWHVHKRIIFSYKLLTLESGCVGGEHTWLAFARSNAA